MPTKKAKGPEAPKTKGITLGTPGNGSISEVDDREWKTRDALRDIERAHKHMSDPRTMADVASHLETMRKVVKVASRQANKTGVPVQGAKKVGGK